MSSDHRPPDNPTDSDGFPINFPPINRFHESRYHVLNGSTTKIARWRGSHEDFLHDNAISVQKFYHVIDRIEQPNIHQFHHHHHHHPPKESPATRPSQSKIAPVPKKKCGHNSGSQQKMETISKTSHQWHQRKMPHTHISDSDQEQSNSTP